MENDDISVTDSDSDTQQVRPNVMADYFDGSVNQTAASLKQQLGIDDDNGLLFEAGQVFSKFYQTQLFRLREPGTKYFEDDNNIFGTYRKYMQIYRPSPDLYFLPITIIFTRRVDLIQLRNKIIDFYKDTANTIYKPSKGQKNEDQITVCVHNQNSINYYRIRNIAIILQPKHEKPECLQKDLCLKFLFDYYATNYDQHYRFSETCGYILYWAYQKNILNDEYFHENVLKMIVTFYQFSSGKGISNIAFIYAEKYEQKLRSLKKMYKVQKDLTCRLDKELFQSYNFSIREKNGFYIQSQRKYSKIKQILPIPFPIDEHEVASYKQKIKRPDGNKKSNPCTIFLKIMLMLNNYIQRSEKITFDFLKTKQGFSETSELDFDIQVIHPVYGNNMCQQITGNSSKIRKIKHQISSVVRFLKQSKHEYEALKYIFSKS